MKLAIPTRNERVDDHFGHSDYFTIHTIENNTVVKSERMESLQGCGCKSNLVEVLVEQNVELMLAGNMGQGAFNKLVESGIKVVRGCSGDINTLLKDFLAGKVSDLNILCDHHGHDHGDGHQCANH
jgi:predicted Fe-Mo cluster-binding NifX family protein